MSKQFLDKQGLTEVSNHLKDKYVSKVDNEQTVKTVQSLDMKRQIREMGEDIVRKTQEPGGITCMFLTGQYRIDKAQADIALPLAANDEIWNEKVKQGDVKLSSDLLLTVTKAEIDGEYIIEQTVQDSFLGVSFTRYSKNSSAQYSDEYLLNYTKTKPIWEWWNLIGDDGWTPWKVENGSCNYQITPFTKEPRGFYEQDFGLLSKDDKIKLDKIDPNKLPKPVSIVDNLTDNGANKALSANQGKILNETKADKTEIKTKLSELVDDSTHRTVTDEEKAKWNGMIQKSDILEMINQMIEKKVKPDSIKGLTMTAVIDQSNPNPLACVKYEDDAKDMVKGSSEWDKFFGAKLVLFKDGKEVRDLQDSELNSLTPDDGDVMVKFRRMGLNIHTVGDKVYVTMTDDPNSSEFKYYAHTRGAERREAFYLGAYLGCGKDGKLRSIKGYEPIGDKIIENFRTIAQANGKGYEIMAFYQWTFIQAMFILKYGNLDSQTALGKGLTDNDTFVNTGGTNGKGIDFGTANGTDQMRFQYLEDVWGNKAQWCDGYGITSGKLWTGTDKFNNNLDGYQSYTAESPEGGYLKKVLGDSERGFVAKEGGASETTYYSDYIYASLSGTCFAIVGGYQDAGGAAGVFHFYFGYDAYDAYSYVGARLMYL